MPEDKISLLIPTYNEAENIESILKRSIRVLGDVGAKYEILVVDDASTDNTSAIAQGIIEGKGKVIRRVSEKRSLSLSVIDGIKNSGGSIIIVMDADGSHPPEIIPCFIENVQSGYDLVIASRYCKGGATRDFPLKRKIASRFACLLGRAVTDIKDNTSGFFCIKRDCLDIGQLNPSGFKIGLEIFVKAKYKAYKEIPFVFLDREKGKSKLKAKTICQFIYHLCQLLNYKLFNVNYHSCPN
ncbi:MAG: polyprenol monophosphomannose synthase [Patescibacteria group bacterium]